MSPESAEHHSSPLPIFSLSFPTSKQRQGKIPRKAQNHNQATYHERNATVLLKETKTPAKSVREGIHGVLSDGESNYKWGRICSWVGVGGFGFEMCGSHECCHADRYICQISALSITFLCSWVSGCFKGAKSSLLTTGHF